MATQTRSTWPQRCCLLGLSMVICLRSASSGLAPAADATEAKPASSARVTADVTPPSVSRPIGPRLGKSEYDWNPDTWGVGSYIWSSTTADKQTCRLWREFEIPRGTTVTMASLRVLADNGYVVLLDGRELGMGSDYYYMTEYDISQVLSPGKHVIAIRAFNESHQAGVVAGLRVECDRGDPIVILSDTSWLVVPATERT